MILVMGATGNIGRHLIAELKRRQAPFKALVRNGAKAKKLLGSDTPLAIADYTDDKSVRRVLTDVTRLFLLTDQVRDQEQLQNRIVDSAIAAGVKQIVKVSAGQKLVHPDSASSACRAHWRTEQYIRATGMAFTFIRPQAFMETTIEMAATQIRRGKLISPFKHNTFSFVSAEDIAAVAAAALTQSFQENWEYSVTGPQALSWKELSVLLSEFLGRPVHFKAVPLWLAKLILQLTYKPKWMGRHRSEMLTELSKPGHANLLSDDILELTGRSAMTFKQWLASHGDDYELNSNS